MVTFDEALDAHLVRILDQTKNLFLQDTSICKKCHRTHNDIYCLFCFCPLYHEDNCGGNPVYLDNGIKDCSFCDRVHDKEFVKKLLKEKLWKITKENL